MSTTKLIAFLLALTSLAGMLFVAFASAAMPIVLRDQISAPPPLDKASPGCIALFAFVAWTPLVAIPGLVGFGLWFFAIRKQEAAVEREAATFPEKEIAFQARLDGLSRRLLECGGDGTALAPEIPVWIRDLDDLQQSRLLSVLAETSLSTANGNVGFLSSPGIEAERSAPGCAKALGMGLFVFAGFCWLWAALAMFVQLKTSLASVQGIAPSPATAVYGTFGCFAPGLAAMIGGIVLRRLLRRETERQKRREAFRNHAREIMLERCLGRLARLFSHDKDSAAAEETAVSRIARADVVCTLAQLDGPGKGRLIAGLHAGGSPFPFSLGRVDLRGAVFVDADLSGADLAGANLSGSHLSGTCLVRANLRGSCLIGADLRRTDATEAVFRQADLRKARLHRCILRRADLSGADLEGANLWQADLSGADLSDARVNDAQLRGSRTGLLPDPHEEALP